ncbi:MAG: hypothetical protein ACI845_001857 [Gammaproteobacteria bacterium]|jgi:hypothetical protein
MALAKIVYEENSRIYTKYDHPQSDDYLEYKSKIQIKDSGKEPVTIKIKLDDRQAAFAPMPPEEHSIKAINIIELYVKLNR